MEGVKRRPATMVQVAKDAGVSVPTVSRVINGSAPVAVETRRAVLSSIARLDYHPNPMARGLSRGHTDTVLVILPHIAEPSVALRLSGLIGVLRESPYELHLVDLERPVDERLRPLGEIVLQNRPAGVIIISLPPDEVDHAGFRSTGAPVVLVDCPSSELPGDAIDDVAGGELATRHLIELGHEKIAFIGDLEETTVGVPASADRRRGFEQALAAAGLELTHEHLRFSQLGVEPARKVTEELLDLDEPPTAIFAASDVQALGAVSAARARGVGVPKDLSIVGFDDIQTAELVELTTVRQPLEASGRRAGIRLLEMLGHAPLPEMPPFPPLEIMVRNTTAPPPTRSMTFASTEAEDKVNEVRNRQGSASRQVSSLYQGGNRKDAKV